jgi:peptidoglycan/xylan/chitin deacetylase (PgdA/CDA1 family)
VLTSRVIAALGRPLDAAVRARRTPAVVVLLYHRVGGRSPSPVDLPRATFERQLDRLVDTDRIIDLDAAVEVLTTATERSDGAPKIVLSFDDGTDDWPDVVLPALVQRRVPATFFVATARVDAGSPFADGARPVSWAGLAEMAGTGLAAIGSHTHTHRVLAATSSREAADEVARSVDLIEDRLDRACRHFAYPKAIAPSPAAEVVVRRRFRTAALAGNVSNAVGATDLHRLGRHAVTVADDDLTFARKAAGGMRLEGWLRAGRDAGQARRLSRSPQVTYDGLANEQGDGVDLVVEQG